MCEIDNIQKRQKSATHAYLLIFKYTCSLREEVNIETENTQFEVVKQALKNRHPLPNLAAQSVLSQEASPSVNKKRTVSSWLQ